MKPEEKNNHYHNILSIIKSNPLAQDQAKEMVLYLESALDQKEQEILEKEALYGGEGRPNMPLPTFGKTFRRAE